MSKNARIILAILGVLGIFGFMLIISGIKYSNTEIRLRNQITAKMQDNTSEYDNIWKKIKQIAQVAEKDRESLKEIFVQHAEARTTDGGGSLMNWIKESVPNIDNTGYTTLMNIITSSRDSWTMRQKELIDLKREHDNLVMVFPSSLFVGKRGKIEITVVTSKKTKRVFEIGEDDDVDVFGK